MRVLGRRILGCVPFIRLLKDYLGHFLLSYLGNREMENKQSRCEIFSKFFNIIVYKLPFQSRHPNFPVWSWLSGIYVYPEE